MEPSLEGVTSEAAGGLAGGLVPINRDTNPFADRTEKERQTSQRVERERVGLGD